MRIFAIVSYKGTNYQGWQRQNNAPTIQEEIEKAISRILNTETVIYGSGRTDAGVHALGQTFHFDVFKNVDLEQLRYSVNCLLPEDIHINSFSVVDDNFHARFSAKGKTYKYFIQLGEKNPLNYETFAWIPYQFDIEKFTLALKKFEGTHNYQDFNSKEDDEDNFKRTIYSTNVFYNQQNNSLEITFNGNGFMRYQIRFMVGTAIAIAKGKEDISFIDYHLNDKNREIVSYKAPSNGLFLVQVSY